MGCNKFDLYLQEKVSGEDFNNHMKNCPACQQAFVKDQDLMDIAGKLNQNLHIPDLWTEIRHEIILAPAAKRKSRQWSRVTAWAAAAATVFIGALYWSLTIPPSDPVESRILSSKALTKVKNAEERYIEAIEELEDLAQARLSETKEPLAQLYRNKLKLIDAQIASCRNELERNPANAHIRKYLLAALQDMQNTLSEIISLKS